MSSIRGEFFKMMMRMQNINPIAHPEMEQKMKRMSQKYSHTKPKKGYTLECLCTKNGTKYQRLRRENVKPSGKVIYYIHGGCYISGLTYNYRDFCSPFCDLINGAEIILLDYKLSPEYKYPTQLDEALDLWKAITTYAKPENIIVGGDSSGGNLALAMLLKLRDENRELPCGCFFLSPWTDMTASGKSYAFNYQKDVEIGDKKGVFDKATRQKLIDSYLFECIGGADRTNPYVSPAFADYSGFPPMMLFAGGHEMLLDDTLAVYNKAKSAGVNVRLETQPGMFHSYLLYQNYMPESKAYLYIGKIIDGVYKNKQKGQLSTSDKIDKVVTNRFLGLPIFIVIMFLVYYLSMVTVGTAATDWMNDGVFGDGYHLFGIGDGEYEEHAEAIGVLTGAAESAENEAVMTALDFESEDYDPDAAVTAVKTFASTVKDSDKFTYEVEDEETLEVSEETVSGEDVKSAAETFEKNKGKPDDPAEFGVWVPGIPVIVGNWLEAAKAPEWLSGLILDGIIAGVGAVLGFVPQMLVLFLLLAILEACGYMARIAFVLDRIFRRFGLSGKSFIPILIGTGCGIPGIMASRTIENERDRRMTIITTTFIPCGAKVPFISMIAGAIFGGSPWVATGAYFIGMAAIIVSGIMLKKTKPFAGEPAPFVMELPAYHLPTIGNVLRSMWERGWSFIKKAGTIILLSTIVLWFLSRFGWVDGAFGMLAEDEIGNSILAAIGNGIAWIFAPLGWGNWQAAVASITGLIAKENIVGTMGVLYGGGELSTWATLAQVFTTVTGFSFLVFNLLCAPCFAAMGAIKREMNSAKWTAFAILYQCGFAYAVALCINQIGGAFTGNLNIIGLIISILLIAGMLFMLFKPYKEANKLTKKVKIK